MLFPFPQQLGNFNTTKNRAWDILKRSDLDEGKLETEIKTITTKHHFPKHQKFNTQCGKRTERQRVFVVAFHCRWRVHLWENGNDMKRKIQTTCFSLVFCFLCCLLQNSTILVLLMVFLRKTKQLTEREYWEMTSNDFHSVKHDKLDKMRKRLTIELIFWMRIEINDDYLTKKQESVHV